MTNRSFMALALAAGAIFGIALGIRTAQPLFISAINSATGVGYATISLAFGVAQLMWGIGQPVAGAVSDRWGPRPVMLTGSLCLAIGTALLPFASSAWALILVIGILAAAGASTSGPAQLASAVARWIPEAKRSMANGIIGAGGSLGQFIIVPLAQLFIGVAGWQPALFMVGALGLAALPLVLFITPAEPVPAGAHLHAGTLRQALAGALRDPSYLLLTAGFFTCGFHIAFIATHLPGIVAFCQLPASVSAWSLSIIGLFNMFGSLWIGNFIQLRRMKMALAGVYFSRALIILVFFFSPKVPLVFFIFAAAIGFTYLSTVPPTIGLVAKLHGARYMATLFGIVMLSHQVGGFLGAWLGGKAFEASGSYDWMWWADIALCLAAAAVHLPIREARPLPAAAPA
ncbi:MAG TPA: MFS transporter [Burkholderiales bacterium]|jgi:predicted MFS family arabinose efflux permease|nr:MFS transporter [Burkholderiales bacterium]